MGEPHSGLGFGGVVAEDEQTVKPVLKIPTREELARIVANFADSQDMALGACPTWRGGTRIPERECLRLSKASQKNLNYVRAKEDGSLQHVGKTVKGGNAVSALSRGMGGGYQQGEGLGASNNTSLYVSSLPPGIDKPQLERLFGGHGRIRKCKVYGGGDALITYFKPNAAAVALSKLNGAKLAKNAIIKVEMADFTRSKRKRESVGPSGLPVPCRADELPVVVLHGMYNAAAAHGSQDGPATFAKSLRQDVKEECGKFGKVCAVVGPIDALDATSPLSGTIAVSFQESGPALVCASVMRGRWYSGRQIEVQVMGNIATNTSTKTSVEKPPQPPSQPQKRNSDDLLSDFLGSV